ncbi:hypothetical protein N9085_00710 [Akkermansiaceae bacterium]|nr:hypothetical protein [Akkermansiaceae bacterium]MDB4412513.1 hypothetical protein [Akkermansiaceae bacterium]MDB4585330.1 hypothetical protein [Akkermansiaceae bacterium]
MTTRFLSYLMIAMYAIGSFAFAQSLQPSWEYSFSETEAGKQIIFITPLNSGTDGSVAFVVTRGDGGGGNLENRIFWLKPLDDGSSPATPIWTSDWESSTGFTDVVAVRQNHLVYSTGRELRSVTIDEDGDSNVSTVKAFAGAEEGGDPLIFTVEQARSPGFVFTVATREDKRGFTLSAFRFAPGLPALSAVPTFTSVTGSNLSLSFQTENGVNYQLQSSTTIESTNWQNIGGVIAGNGTIQTLVQQAGAPTFFFRVVAL